jgi:hypothetical protein
MDGEVITPQQFDYKGKDQLRAGLLAIQSGAMPTNIRNMPDACLYVFGVTDDTVVSYAKKYGIHSEYTRARNANLLNMIHTAATDLMDDTKMLSDSDSDDAGRRDQARINLQDKRIRGLALAYQSINGTKIESTNYNIDVTKQSDEIIEKLGGTDAARDVLAKLAQ